MVIGGRQLGLAILMHDAAHGRLFVNRRLNDSVGAWLCAYPVLTSLALYRPYHLQHHRFTQQAEDPRSRSVGAVSDQPYEFQAQDRP